MPRRRSRLAGGVVYKDADFGYYRTPSDGTAFIGDTVWYDDNGDGVQQPGEPGIPGVTVVIRNSSGTAIKQAVTNGLGHYLVEVPIGSGYTVVVDEAASSSVLAGLSLTTPNVVNLPPLSKGQQFLDADFGYDDKTQDLLGDVGNLVWLDTDKDGVFDPGDGEAPLAGVSVSLIRDTNGDGVWDLNGADDILGNTDDEPNIATATTGSTLDAQGGNYLFTGVPQGAYLVHVSDTNAVLVDFSKSPLGRPERGWDQQGGSVPGEPGGEGANNLKADFGYYRNPGDKVGVIGNQVWIESRS